MLHRESFGADMSPQGVFHRLGPHQRITGPRGGWLKLVGIPEDNWPLPMLLGGIWSIFPHGSIAGFDLGNGDTLWQVARIFPGADPESSISHMDYLSFAEPTEENLAPIDDKIKFLVHGVGDEDDLVRSSRGQ